MTFSHLLQILHPELLPGHTRAYLSLPARQGAAQQREVCHDARDGRVHRDGDPGDDQIHEQLRRGCGNCKVSSGSDVQVSLDIDKLRRSTSGYSRSEQQKLGLEIGAKRSTTLGQNIYAGRSSG